MTTAATSLLGLALPVTGELSGTWGDTVNNSITSLLDSAIAGTTTLSTDADVTLTTTTLSANQAREAIILWTAAGTVTRTITAPAQSKTYVVINKSSTQSIKLVGVGPTTGVTLVAGEYAVVAWNGTDFVKTANASGAASFTDLTVSGSETLSGGTANGVAYLNGSKVVTTGSALTFDGTNFVVTSSASSLRTSDPSTGYNYYRASNTNGNFYFGIDSAAGGFFGTANARAIYADGAYPMVFYTNATEKMRLDSSGNLALGTTSSLSPSSGRTDLTINGASTGAIISFGNGGTRKSYVYQDGTDFSIFNEVSTGVLRFGTNGSERARIDSSGNLLVGTTSNVNSGKTTVAYSGATNNGLSLSETANTSGCTYIGFYQGSSVIGNISRVGATSAVVYSTTSDYRLKTVIGPVTDAGQRIDALQPIEYTWNADGSHTRGFLAHQFQEVYAGSVSGSKDAIDADGKPVYQAMQASTPEVIADLVAEIQDLRKRLAAAGIA